MDRLPSCATAASTLGFSASHPFVFLSNVLQDTCLKVEESTNNELLLAVTVTRVGASGGL